ncbi:hypothetical protein PILCRDRAFT_822928 [Piloderma croceum F 1598]|uniref:Uncharacterized protein n=1 Tax=Piloderma croceum (strain F 1598) TaxID=765440 RepID=A0A0C3BRW4_PILCF|nr:hypothetical protein PILCRDRAFT_822928 [Piloderma croceum F 1598]
MSMNSTDPDQASLISYSMQAGPVMLDTAIASCKPVSKRPHPFHSLQHCAFVHSR